VAAVTSISEATFQRIALLRIEWGLKELRLSRLGLCPNPAPYLSIPNPARKPMLTQCLPLLILRQLLRFPEERFAKFEKRELFAKIVELIASTREYT
jgi:hypothetical protein